MPAAVSPVLGPVLGNVAQLAKDTGVTRTKAYEQRQREARIAASIARAEAKPSTAIAATSAG